ncbi:hypothetical protein SCLCIDRAFT_1215113 [Scleroderma citrinum Foug A]|uniref:Uncharacterized protein n=1 Tax=Scleroderma citrinum Foug A TaxID=1036808 RepID=A0A0C3DPG2_9AGAM|nr:hypothetical protein SCLCIDRAFT_1215113 [Scleroderma citrinum Foug A]
MYNQNQPQCPIARPNTATKDPLVLEIIAMCAYANRLLPQGIRGTDKLYPRRDWQVGPVCPIEGRVFLG